MRCLQALRECTRINRIVFVLKNVSVVDLSDGRVHHSPQIKERQAVAASPHHFHVNVATLDKQLTFHPHCEGPRDLCANGKRRAFLNYAVFADERGEGIHEFCKVAANLRGRVGQTTLG